MTTYAHNSHKKWFIAIKTIVAIFFTLIPCFANSQNTCFCFIDDNDKFHTLYPPINKVISLVPHASEIIAAAGGINFLVGATDHALPIKLPSSTKKLGHGFNVSEETIIGLNPDFIMSWQKKKYQNINWSIPILISRPNEIQQISKTIKNLGIVFQTEKIANIAVKEFNDNLNSLLSCQKTKKKEPTVFLQLSIKPMYTLTNYLPLYKQIMQICGGHNIFDSITLPAAIVNIEEIIKKDPDAIISFSDKKNNDDLAIWKNWPFLKAVRKNNLYKINSDIISRPGPRIISGIKILCKIIDQIRTDI